ncbi:MAG: hypothetical protein AAGF47_07275 [Planctomycetota bacterium]
MTDRQIITVVDGHVHLRDRFNPSDVLDAAWTNLGRAAARLGEPSFRAMLLLAEADGEHAFERLAGSGTPVGRWRTEPTAEPAVLRVVRDDAAALTLVQGRQWACDERLEVLTLGSGAQAAEGLADGMPIRECIRAGLELGAVVTLPWGVGKWTGPRRGLMLELLEEFGGSIAVGDSMARPRGFSDRVLARAAADGVPILPGTDPLPIGRHRNRVGRFGWWHGSPAASGAVEPWLRSAVRSIHDRGGPIGARDHAPVVAIDQVRLRLASR